MCHLAICTKGVRLWGTPGEGSPPKNSPLDCFSPLLRSLWAKISQPAGCDGGAAPQPCRLLKKAAENFWAFCYHKTVYRQTDSRIFAAALLSCFWFFLFRFAEKPVGDERFWTRYWAVCVFSVSVFNTHRTVTLARPFHVQVKRVKSQSPLFISSTAVPESVSICRIV